MINPIEFVREVRAEVAKVTWPTRRETMITTSMVFIFVVIAALFFLVADKIIGFVVKALLGVCDGSSLVRGSRLFGLREQGRPVDPRTGRKEGLGRGDFRSDRADR